MEHKIIYRTSQRKRVRIDNITILFLKGLGFVVRYGQVFILGIVIAVTFNKYKKYTDMKRIITIILMCLPFVAFGQTDYVDRFIKTDEYEIMANKITYKEPLEFNTLDEAFSFLGRANRTENVRIIEDEELGIVSYKTLDVIRIVRVYGITFQASYSLRKFVSLTYYTDVTDYFLKTLLLKVKEEYAPNSEIKKKTFIMNERGISLSSTEYYVGGYIIDDSTLNGKRFISIKKEKDATIETGLYTR